MTNVTPAPATTPDPAQNVLSTPQPPTAQEILTAIQAYLANPTPAPVSTPVPTAPKVPSPFSFAAAKKGYTAGFAGLLVSEGTVLTPMLASGALTQGDLPSIIAAGVLGFVVPFFGAWIPTNK